MAEPRETRSIQGKGHVVEVAADAFVQRLEVQGSGNIVRIGAGCRLNGYVVVKAHGAELTIGAGTTANGLRLSMHERARLSIGEDCMFSSEVRLDVSDMHPIIDVASGQRINPAEDISIGRHVWLGYRTVILKGAVIGEHAIIGAGSVVTGAIPSNSLAVGAPARVIRTGVTWRRELPP